MKSPLSALLAVSTALVLSGCSLLQPADSEPDPTSPPSSREAPTTTASPERQLTEFDLRGIVFSRDDFPFEWTSVPSSGDDDGSLMSGAGVSAEAEYAACLGMDPADMEIVLEVESDSYVLQSALIGAISHAGQYRTTAGAIAEFNATSTPAGRECVRRFLRADDPTMQEVYVTSCDPLEDLRVESRCSLLEVVTLDEETGESYLMTAEIHQFRSGSVIASAGFLLYDQFAEAWPTEPSNALVQAAYALSDRLAALDVD